MRRRRAAMVEIGTGEPPKAPISTWARSGQAKSGSRRSRGQIEGTTIR